MILSLAESLRTRPAAPPEDWQAMMAAFCDAGIADDDKARALDTLHSIDISGDMLAACATYLLDHALPLHLDPTALDVCGTGGDKSKQDIKTFNISTAVAFVLAAADVPVIKHGNRAVSSQSGSSDVLAALQVPVATDDDTAQKSFAAHGLCFVAAPAFHPTLRHLAAARKMLGMPTFINLLGPLCNPARVTRQVMGVFHERYLLPVAEAARKLGKTDMIVVHSTDGLDEFSIAAPSYVCRLQNGTLDVYTIAPSDAGLDVAPLESLAGGDAAANAAILRDIFTKPHGACADIVTLNAAVALQLAGKAPDLKAAAKIAADVLKSGKALQKLNDMTGVA